MPPSDTHASLPLVMTDDEADIRAAVREICQSVGPQYMRQCFEAGTPPVELWKALAAQGFVAVNVGQEWGGGGQGLALLAAIAEEAAACGCAMLMMVLSSAMAGSILERHGTEAQRQRWLQPLAAGDSKFAFAITEADAGSNAHNLRTELRRAGQGYVLRGQKVFTSCVDDADGVLVVARLRGEDGQLGQPCLVLVDTDAEGFSKTEIPMPYLGAEKQWTLFFDDVKLYDDRLIGGERGGLAPVFDALNPERIMVAALAIGTARLALARAADYAKQRVVWNAPIGSHQGIAHALAKCKIELNLAELMTRKAAALFDADSPQTGEVANIAKYAAAEAASHCVDTAIQTHGGNGMALEYGLSDLWWLVRFMRIGPVSSEMILNFVAQHSLGLPRSY